MKRRDAFKGIIGVTTIGFAFVKGIDIFDKGNQTSFKDISEYTMLISELTDVSKSMLRQKMMLQHHNLWKSRI